MLCSGKRTPFGTAEATDDAEHSPLLLGKLKKAPLPENGCEKLYETAMFSIDNDCLEARCRKRSGNTAIPEVKAARDAFFAQKLYKLRGTEAKFMFDGKPDTFFDGLSKTYQGNPTRIDEGCLRIDFGKNTDADTMQIEFFAVNTPTYDIRQQNIPFYAEYSADLNKWNSRAMAELKTLDANAKQEVVKDRVHTTYFVDGARLCAVYPIDKGTRYVRISEPMDRIYSVKLFKNGKELTLEAPFANNLQAHYCRKHTQVMKIGAFVLPAYREGAYLAVAADGTYGEEDLYCCAELDGKLTGFPSRAPEYKANQWEHRVCGSESNHTFYFPLPADGEGKEIKIFALFSCNEINENGGKEVPCSVYLCAGHR